MDCDWHKWWSDIFLSARMIHKYSRELKERSNELIYHHPPFWNKRLLWHLFLVSAEMSELRLLEILGTNETESEFWLAEMWAAVEVIADMFICKCFWGQHCWRDRIANPKRFLAIVWLPPIVVSVHLFDACPSPAHWLLQRICIIQESHSHSLLLLNFSSLHFCHTFLLSCPASTVANLTGVFFFWCRKLPTKCSWNQQTSSDLPHPAF